jgi:type I restriction enzyme S subunit
MKAWQTKRLGELAAITLGKTPSRTTAEFWDKQKETQNIWLSIADLLNEQDNIVSNSKEYISDKGAALCMLAREGTLLVSFKLTLGRLAFAGRDLYTNEAIAAITPFNEHEVSKAFLFWFLKFFDWQKAAEGDVKIKGMTLNKAKLKELTVRFPPLAEQQRLVSLLNEAFASIAKAVANTDKNLNNARSLFRNYVQSLFNQRGNGWEDRKLDQVCIVERGSSPRPIKQYFTTASEGVNWIKIGDTEEGGKYVYSTAQKITPKGAEQSRFVKEGDFILTNSMSFGRPYIMKTSGYIHDGWFVLRLNQEINTDYFYYLLSSSFVQEQFSRLAAGSVVKNISGNLVKQAVLPIPPLEQQLTITERLTTLEAETQHLARLYEDKLAALEALKKSLLHQAFTGQL